MDPLEAALAIVVVAAIAGYLVGKGEDAQLWLALGSVAIIAIILYAGLTVDPSKTDPTESAVTAIALNLGFPGFIATLLGGVSGYAVGARQKATG